MSKKNWIYGRNIVVSGCSTGIGKELTLQLVKEFGCNVMGIARNQQKLDALKQELGDKFDYRRFDIADEQAWNDFAQELENIGFMTDVLINNAGMIQDFSQYGDVEMPTIKKIINTNFNSIIYSVSAMLPTIKKSSFGYIVNISSASAILPVAGETVYSATKSAVTGFSISLAQDLAGLGIGVSYVMPGPVKTDLYKQRDAEVQDKKDYALVESIGITAQTAAKRIIKGIRARKQRILIDAVAKMMALGMKLMPGITPKITGTLIQKFSSKVPAFGNIYKEHNARKQEVEAMIKSRKDNIYNSLDEVPKNGAFNQKQ